MKKKHPVLICVLSACLATIVDTIPVDNGVEGNPEIICGESTLSIIFIVQKPFHGHVYVKGRYEDPNCRRDGSSSLEAEIELPFSSCGIRRIRSVNPIGVNVEATVIISFHPQFVTKVDRAYAIQCFYMEAEKTVTAGLEVSMLTTSSKAENVPMPTCRYEVLQDGPTGLPVRYARVGDPVYHKWTCDSQTVSAYCMLIHTCTVDDGAGKTIELLDINGCAVDKYLLGNLEYTSDLMAGKEAHVFKYADRPNLYFNCQIKITVKEPSEVCERAVCHEPERGKRKRRQLSHTVIAQLQTLANLSRNGSFSYDDEISSEIDVNSNPITVLDLDSALFDSDSDLAFLTSGQNATAHDKRVFCLSIGAFSVFVLISAAILLISILVICSSWRRRTVHHTADVKQFRS